MKICDRFTGAVLFEDQHTDIAATVVHAWGVDKSIMRKANLVGAELYRLYLDGVDFTFADLAGANFKSSNLEGASFNHAVLSLAQLSDAVLMRADFRGARANGAVFDYANLEQARFEQADLRDASFVDARLLPGALSVAYDLTGANFGDPPSYTVTAVAQRGRYASPVSDVPTGPQTRVAAASPADCAYYGTCVLNLVDPHVPRCNTRA